MAHLRPLCVLQQNVGMWIVLKTLLRLGFSATEGYYSHPYTIHPIHEACEQGNIEIVKLLVEDYDVDIKYRIELLVEDQPFWDLIAPEKVTSLTALHLAAKTDQVEICTYLLSKEANLNLGDHNFRTPLMYAAENGSCASAKVLLEAGADVNIDDMYEQTVFHIATQKGDVKMMELLLLYGADPEKEESHLGSPLNIALFHNFDDVAEYLINKVNVNLYRSSFLEDCCRVALQQRNYNIVRLLINAGYDPSVELAAYEVDEENKTVFKRGRRGQMIMIENLDREQFLELRDMIALASRPRSLNILTLYSYNTTCAWQTTSG